MLSTAFLFMHKETNSQIVYTNIDPDLILEIPN